ncbi:unnamed protein product [Symbiodinium sp. CCMP2592]|nr:unnamed protein product [Symbiodinium sp. CCMP2592]
MLIFLAALRPSPLVEGFSAGSYTGQLRHIVKLGALGMPDFIFEQIIGLPITLWLLHAGDDQLCPFRPTARLREQLNADLRGGAGGLVWITGGTSLALFGSTCHGSGHLLGRVEGLPGGECRVEQGTIFPEAELTEQTLADLREVLPSDLHAELGTNAAFRNGRAQTQRLAFEHGITGESGSCRRLPEPVVRVLLRHSLARVVDFLYFDLFSKGATLADLIK